MTASEKADELTEKYEIWVGVTEDSDSIIEHGTILRRSARRCAAIAVNEIIDLNVDWNPSGSMKAFHCGIESTREFWEEVFVKLKSMI